jgi:hypothetical protein
VRPIHNLVASIATVAVGPIYRGTALDVLVLAAVQPHVVVAGVPNFANHIAAEELYDHAGDLAENVNVAAAFKFGGPKGVLSKALQANFGPLRGHRFFRDTSGRLAHGDNGQPPALGA